MENKEINAIPEEVAQDIQNTSTDINTEEPIEAVGCDDTSDVIDAEGIRQCAEEFEAELLTIAPVGEAPEIPTEKVSTAKRIKEYFGSIKWQRTWDKISLGLLLFLFAIPVLILVYVLTYFF